MMTTKIMPVAINNDAELVHGTLAGNRDAFGQIVSRYQSLICSLAYSATGSLGQSEDLAQETFITAWKHLRHLRERDKLRAWLCGIARNRINNFLRREGREPIRAAESLENVAETHSPEPLPTDQTISNEEQAILWRSLERIPEIYREPLVLFYREHQSIETVAQSLDLTEDTVKQRLSRGRKLLHEQVLAFVEGALERTNPGKIFTVGVLAALPATLATSAKAATVTVATAKGGATAKTAGAMGLFGVLATPLLIIFGNFIPYRMALAEAGSDEESRRIKSYFHTIYAASFGLATLFTAALYFIGRAEYGSPPGALDLFRAWFIALVIFYLLAIFISASVSLRKRRAYYAKILAQEHGGVYPEPAFEFCSKTKLFGLPLVHVRIGDRFDILRKPVTAWIAVGNCAIGGLFAFGAMACAPLCIGGLTIGLVPFGGLAFGIMPLGGIALGVMAFGGLVIGWQAIGGFAIGWKAAVGSLAIAHDFARGGMACAAQANNDPAEQFTNASVFFRFIQTMNQHWVWMNFLWIVPLFVQWQVIARSRRRERANECGPGRRISENRPVG
jgi:RNA polymerase sigma factor (sigma-70 family)